MPSFRSAFPARWLKAEDCHPPVILTIKTVGFEDVGSGADVKRKLVVRFEERPEGFILNVTNGNLIAALLGTDDYDDWVGSRICLASRKVPFKDGLVDAIRVQPIPSRKPRPPAAPPAPTSAAPASPAPASPAPASAAAAPSSKPPLPALSGAAAPVLVGEEEPDFIDEEGLDTEVGF